MCGAAAALPESLAASIEEAARLPLFAGPPPELVVLVGDGPAGIAAEMAAAILDSTARAPVVRLPAGAVPAFVGPTALVIVTSFAGDDPGGIAAAKTALRQGARLIAVTPQGALARFAARRGAPSVALPAAPRARGALLAMLAALVAGLGRAGLVSEAGVLLDDARRQAARRRDSLVVAGGGSAAELVRRIGRTFPLLVGGAGLGAAAARWWQSEIAVNARTPSVVLVAPGLLWDTIAAFGQGGDVTRQILTLVELRSDHEPPGAGAAFARVDELVGEVVADRLVVRAEGPTPLAQLVDLIVLGEFVSLRLADAAGIDPGPAPAVDDGAAGAGA